VTNGKPDISGANERRGDGLYREEGLSVADPPVDVPHVQPIVTATADHAPIGQH
jgi:hypothetical protein